MTEFTEEEVRALRVMIEYYISEGWHTPPYPEVVYDIFEKLGAKSDPTHSYDITRPADEKYGSDRYLRQ